MSIRRLVSVLSLCIEIPELGTGLGTKASPFENNPGSPTKERMPREDGGESLAMTDFLVGRQE